MILHVMEKEGQYRVTIKERGMETAYDAIFHVCDSPVCTCGNVEMSLTPATVDQAADRPLPPRMVSIDVLKKKLARKGNVKMGNSSQ